MPADIIAGLIAFAVGWGTVLGLAERLDFAERRLSQQPDRSRIGGA